MRLKGIPTLQGAMKTITGDEAYTRARAYVASTNFIDAFKDGSGGLQEATAGADSSAEDSGIIREDRRENPEPDLHGWALDKVVVQPGENVCVFGVYRASDESLHSPARPTKARQYTLVIGDAEKVRKTLALQRTALFCLAVILVALQLIALWLVCDGTWFSLISDN